MRDLPGYLLDVLLHLALELPHPLLVRDPPLLVNDLSPIELDLSQLVVDNGDPPPFSRTVSQESPLH